MENFLELVTELVHVFLRSQQPLEQNFSQINLQTNQARSEVPNPFRRSIETILGHERKTPNAS